VGIPPKSLNHSFETRSSRYEDDSDLQAKSWQCVERSRFVEILDEVCLQINYTAGTTMVEKRSYPPPEALIRSFICADGKCEYGMQIEVWGQGVALSFYAQKWRGAARRPLVRWLCRFVNIEPAIVNFKTIRLIEHQRLTREQIENWFHYLLSGLSHEFIPFGPVSLGRKWHQGEHRFGESAQGLRKDAGLVFQAPPMRSEVTGSLSKGNRS
jgi:hypothetical protein